MHLFTCDKFSGTLTEDCCEGELLWVDKNKISELPIWEGDKIFFKLLAEEDRFFSLRLEYIGDTLNSHKTEYR